MPDQRELLPMVRKLVSLPTTTVAAVGHRARVGIENERFGGPPRSEAEALRRLIILGLEHNEGKRP